MIIYRKRFPLKKIFSFNIGVKPNKSLGTFIGNFSYSLTDEITKKKEHKLLYKVKERLMNLIKKDLSI